MPIEDTQVRYFKDVRTIAQMAFDEYGEQGEEIENFIQETVDGNYWVIYTHAARKVIQYSSNDYQIFDIMGKVEATNWSDLFTQAAYYAMLADVYQALEQLFEDEE